MADKAWAKKLYDTWRQQQDPQGLLSQTRHYSPEFVLQRFCSGRARSVGVFESRPWQTGRDDDLLTVYDVEDKTIEDVHWSETFGTPDIYSKIIENFSKEAYTRDGRTFKVFDMLQGVDEQIFRGLVDPIWQIYQNSGNGSIILSRHTINTLRKFLFLTSSVQNKDDIQHLVLNDGRMTEAKNKRKAFMKDRKLGHERELWLSNTAQILRSHHYDVASQPEISELDRDDYRANARERFVVFWRPAEKGDEFILTDNSFGCFEGGILGADAKLTIKMDVSEQARHVYTKDYMWHQLYVISPTLMIALCHGSLADKELTRQHRKRYGLGPSLLEKLPHICPKNYYRDMTRDECRFLDNSWVLPPEFANGFSARVYDGKSAMADGVEKETLCYPILSLESDHVARVNAVLLQSRSTPSPLELICIRPPAEHCLLRALAVFEKIDWAKNSPVSQRKGYTTLRKQLRLRNSYRRDTETTNSATSFSSAQSRSSGSGVPITPEENPFDRRSDPPSSPRSERVRQVRPHPGPRDPMPDQRPDPLASSDPNVGSKEQAQPRWTVYRDHRRTAAPEHPAPEQEQPRPGRPVSCHETFPTINLDIPAPPAEQSRSRGSSYYREQKRMATMGQSDGSREQSRSRGSSFYHVEIPQTPTGHPTTPLDQSWHTVTSSSSYPDKHMMMNGAPPQSRPRPRNSTSYRESDVTNTVQAEATKTQPRPRPTSMFYTSTSTERPDHNKEHSPKRSLSRDKQTTVNIEKAEPKQERPKPRRMSSLRDKHPTIITEQPEPINELPQRHGSTKRDKNTEIITEQPPSPGELRYRRTSTYHDGRKTIIKEPPQSARKQSRRLSTHRDIPNKIVTEQPETTQEPPQHPKKSTSSDKPAKIVADGPDVKKDQSRSQRLPTLHDKQTKIFDDSEATVETPARTRPQRRMSYREARRPPTIEDESPVLVEPLSAGDDQQSHTNRVARALEYVQTQQAYQPLPVPSAVEAGVYGTTGSTQVTSNGDSRPVVTTATATTAASANTLQSPQRKERRYHMKPVPLETPPPLTSSVIVELGMDDDILAWEDEGFVEGLPEIDEDGSPTWPPRKPTVRFEKTSPKPYRKDGPIRKTSFADIGRVRFMNRRQRRS